MAKNLRSMVYQYIYCHLFLCLLTWSTISSIPFPLPLIIIIMPPHCLHHQCLIVVGCGRYSGCHGNRLPRSSSRGGNCTIAKYWYIGMASPYLLLIFSSCDRGRYTIVILCVSVLKLYYNYYTYLVYLIG